MTEATAPSVIALDGLPASGKTTVGRALAERLGYRFLDTGLLYRAVAWASVRHGIPLSDTDRLVEACRTLRVELGDGAGATRVWVLGQEVTAQLREAAVEEAVSAVAAVPEVRAALLDIQRDLAATGRIVVAGQDIGSAVLPEAPLKVFLHAPLETRAYRRALEQEAAGDDDALNHSRAALARRSEQDARRSVAPLAPAPDAVLIDTGKHSVEEVVELILDLMRRDP